MTADLVVVGDCNPDVLMVGEDVTPVFGQFEKIVPSGSLAVGGSATITAMAAARLGVRVALVAAVGDDPAGDFMLRALRDAGVDTTHVVVRGGTGLTVALSRGVDRAILTAPGAIPTLRADDVPAELVEGARHLHVSAYFLLTALAPGLAGLFARARSAGVRTSLDTNWDPAGLWRDARLGAALAETDLFLPNEAEALRIGERRTLEEAVTAILGDPPERSVVVKLGADGAMAASGTDRFRATPPPAGPVVDTTGAGDSFNAGLLAGLVLGHPLRQAVALGCAVGTASTTAPGGTAGHPRMAAALDLAAAVTFTG